MDTDRKNIVIMGMGYVGLTLSVILAKAGFKVYGIEKNKEVVSRLRKGDPHFHEKGLNILLQKSISDKSLEIYEEIPNKSIDVFIISVGTPLKKDSKEPNLEHIQNVLSDVGKTMKKGSLIVLRSTIPVGLSRTIAIPTLEKVSGLKAGKDFYFVFAPERTIEGKALTELESNSQIIGGFDEKSVSLASDIFHKITHTVVCVSSLESAEIIKLMDNTYRDVRFAYSNEVAMICEKIGVDATEVIKAANVHYPRNNIPFPSPGVGGACLSKDPYIMYDFADKRGYSPLLIKSAREINEFIPGQIVSRLKAKLEEKDKDIKNSKIFIIGFAFKGDPETSDIRDSTTLWFLNELKKEANLKNICGFDPVIEKKEIEKLGIKVCNTIEEGCINADIVLFMNNHQSYLNIDPYKICSKMNKPAIFYDSWRMFEKKMFANISEVDYMGVGL